jgi:phosphonate metabolism protein PhnN/1,5-bisphosphokinase (PRPP-forming)
VLVGVVGPSGAGKDTLLAGARQALAGDPLVRFVRRVITRPVEAGGEDHDHLSPEAFRVARAAGVFALSWEAHGHGYGIPADIAQDLARGHVVVANLSRRVLQEAAPPRFPLLVLEITAPPEVLAARLAARGRESAEDIARRLSRQAPIPRRIARERVVNDGSVEQGVAQMVQVIRLALTATAIQRLGD